MRSELRRSPEQAKRNESSYQLELGGKSLVGLFCIAAVICGMFFAFGYTLGKHAIPATFALGQNGMGRPTAGESEPPNEAGVQAPNPTELGQAETNQTPQALTPATGAGTSSNTGTGSGSSSTPPAQTAAEGTPSAGVGNAAAPPSPASASSGSAPAATAPDSSVYRVQVFAGVKADAESLASALQQRGYPVRVVPPSAGETDLFRVQVGPYLTRAEAQAMRARLTADGYQAIVK